MVLYRIVLVFCLAYLLCGLEMASAKLGPDPMSISFADGFLYDMSPIVSPEFLLAAFASIYGEASLVLVKSDTYQLSVISNVTLWTCEPQLAAINSDAVLLICQSSIALVTVTDFTTITISRKVAVPNLGRPFVPAIGSDNLESLWFFQNDTLFRFDITSFRLAVVATDVWKSTAEFWAGAASPKSILVGVLVTNETILLDGNSGAVLAAQSANMHPVPVFVTATNGFTVDSANVGSLRVTNWNWNTLTPKPKTFSIPSSMPVSTGLWQMSYGSSFFAVGAYRDGGSMLSQVGIDAATGEATAVLDQVPFDNVGISSVAVGMDEKHVFVSIYPTDLASL